MQQSLRYPNYSYSQTAISTCEELQAIDNNLSGDYILTDDIDCSDTVNWNGGLGFSPIALGSGFSGTFDGNCHTITGLYINRPNNNHIGLFSVISNAVIQNVHLSDIDITGHDWTAGLIGRIIGGDVRYVSTGGIIKGTSRVGGITGELGGGELNYDVAQDISSSYSTSQIIGLGEDSFYCGGIMGVIRAGSTINNSYATGNINCAQQVGGLIGINYEVEEWEKVTISNCYSTGFVSGTTDVGGLVGASLKGIPSISNNNYWNTETSGLTTSFIGEGKTTAQMQSFGTFIGWDWYNVWEAPNRNYPTLKNSPLCKAECSGCAVLGSDGICVAGDSCSGEYPNCVVSNNVGICECTTNSCNDGRQCSSNGICSDCSSTEGCGACGCGSSQKPTGSGSCLNNNSCCPGECNAVTGADSCSYSDALCPSSACNRKTLSCCATSLPYWRSSACRACSNTSGLSGTCTTQGMECNAYYNCVKCKANTQCTCDIGEVADGSGNCVTPACSDDSECGIDQCVNAGEYNAFCSNCSSYSKVWKESSCVSCPSDATYFQGICICDSGKSWNRLSNSCTNSGVVTSSGTLIESKRNSSNSATGRYDRIKSRMNRIRSKIQNGTGDK